MATKREQLIVELEAQKQNALHDFDENIAIYLNRIKAADIVATRTGFKPGAHMQKFMSLFKHETCGQIIKSFNDLQKKTHDVDKRIHDLSIGYTGVVQIEKTSPVEDICAYVEDYVSRNGIEDRKDQIIVVVFHDLRKAKKFVWNLKKNDWFYSDVNYEDMCVYFEFPNKE